MQLRLRVDHTFEDLFTSLGGATAICTLMVSLGKLLTPNYFIYIITMILMTVTTLLFRVHKQHQKSKKTPMNRILDGQLSSPISGKMKRKKKRKQSKVNFLRRRYHTTNEFSTRTNPSRVRRNTDTKVERADLIDLMKLKFLLDNDAGYMSSSENGPLKMYPGITRCRKSGVDGIQRRKNGIAARPT